ncbi:YkgJ family cysteine cluster protein [Blastopirellula retiformator]|uniref:Flagellin N-methylase n=1 Tax=Blastopirellula retiformator TaxID=2527970 RepID=A0A5C5UTF8_9BACT|nr:YkgJ family cysteine cluster protein [Blastopirellula retiformator]TWT29704.1 Flagellin N-methylase [Blastopirellula retiformator]
MSDSPWYRDGLRFECSQCGDCCTGAPGYVWVNDEEIAQLAACVELSVDQFETAYVRKVGLRKSLREYGGGECVFFDTQSRGCTVYTARPRQCKTWPFWDSNIRTEEDWKATCEMCPGSGKGPLYQLEEIDERRSQIRI